MYDLLSSLRVIIFYVARANETFPSCTIINTHFGKTYHLRKTTRRQFFSLPIRFKKNEEPLRNKFAPYRCRPNYCYTRVFSKFRCDRPIYICMCLRVRDFEINNVRVGLYCTHALVAYTLYTYTCNKILCTLFPSFRCFRTWS